jgi:hypothetical protein
MAFNGTGTFVRIYNWATDKINSVPITASRMDTEIDGIATGLSNCLTKDGQTTVTANIPMASHKFTGLSVGNARTDSLTLGQVQDGQFTALGLTGGAADAYTATPSPAIAAYVATMQYSAKIHATNLTTTPTLLISAISGGTIKKLDASKAEVEVEASDMLVNGFYNFKRNVANDAWILLNPEKAYYNLTNSTAATESVAGIAILPKQITIANGTDADHDLNFGAFNAQADDGSLVFSVSALTKQIDATWAAGNDQGGLDTGTVANSIPYYIFAIYNPSTLVSDILFSASKTSPTLPSGFTKKEYKGACHTDGSANIRNGLYIMFNGGYEFFYKERVASFSSNTIYAAGTLITLEAPANSISNISANYRDLNNSSTFYILIKSNSETTSPSLSLCDMHTNNSGNVSDIVGSISKYILSDDNSQITIISSINRTTKGVKLATIGWKEYL